jgi:hypothetical protein
MKVATSHIKQNLNLQALDPAKKSIQDIVDEVNKLYGSKVHPQTAACYVHTGLVGVSPLTLGPVGHFPKVIYKSLVRAYATYLELKQAGCKRQSTINQLVKLVNATVNAGGFHKTDGNLTCKLQKDTACEFEVGKPNIIEQQHIEWTTSYHLNMWYSSF